MIEKTGMLKIKTAEISPQNYYLKNEYVKNIEETNEKDFIAEAIEQNKENLINIFRLVAVRTENK